MRISFLGDLESHPLKEEVTSCVEAARAKGIPLKNELKTLILQTSKGLYALHLTGDRKASLRAVKKFLKVKEAYLAQEEKLRDLNLNAGMICPLINPVWQLPHLISEEVLSLDYVSTNDGTKRGYIKFDPRILLSANNIEIGKFDLDSEKPEGE